MTSQMSSVRQIPLVSINFDRTPLSVSMDPPLPVYLFNVVSGLKEKSAKGYPIKKVELSSHYLVCCLLKPI